MPQETVRPEWSFETKQVHAGAVPDPTTGARAVPIYQTTSYSFRDTEHAAALFALGEPGNIYTRIMNPTQDVFEQRVNALEGGVGALAVASGQAAETLAILNLAQSGDHLVSSASLYGGTYNLFHYTLPRLGIHVSFIDDPDDLDAWRAAIRPNTKAFYAETIGNPKGDVLDFEAVSALAHDNGLPLLSTTRSPRRICAGRWSTAPTSSCTARRSSSAATAPRSAASSSDGGTFDWGAGKHPSFTEPDPSYHGLRYAEALGPMAYILKARVQLLRDLGPAIAPLNSFLFLQGLETLSLRMERHCSNAQRVAEWLEGHDEVEWVAFPGLPSSPLVRAGQKYLPLGSGAVAVLRYQGRCRGGS